MRSALSPAASKVALEAAYGKLPLSFEQNQGQTDKQVKFLARGSGYTLFLTGSEAVLSLKHSDPSRDRRLQELKAGRPIMAERSSKAGATPTVLRMKLVSANASPKVEGVEPLPSRSNYFIGSDPAKWQAAVPTYAKVSYREVYPGVDLVYYGNQRQLEYDFVVAPGASPKLIGLEIAGASEPRPLRVDEDGNLVVHITGGEVSFHKPVIYQPANGSDRQPVDGRYVLKGKYQVAFEVAAYDRSKPLVIDPSLSYSTYLGGSADDQANAIAVGSDGSAYVAGETVSADFPPVGSVNNLGCTLGWACGAANAGTFSDVFVVKLNPDGSLGYSTYLGGSLNDAAQGIAVDSSGDAYLTGSTDSANFPTAATAPNSVIQSASAGGSDAFVAELNSSGNGLIYSTYLGGDSSDIGQAIAVDSSGNAYVTGSTFSSTVPFPTLHAYQDANQGSSDAFVTKIGPSGAGIVYSTYLGGSGVDAGLGIAVDSSGNAYVTGDTLSGNAASGGFPQVNAVSAACPGTCGAGTNEDAFVTELAFDAISNTLSPVYSTLLGGSGDELGFGIAVDGSGNAYVTGQTDSADFPTLSAYQATYGGSTDAFVTEISHNGSALAYSTYLGGSSLDEGLGIAVDSGGNAYVTGFTSSTNFPTLNAIPGSCTPPSCPTGGAGDSGDVFVTLVNAGGATLGYSTYLGGSDFDGATGIAIDSSGNAYITGFTFSPGVGVLPFPTLNALQSALGGGEDAFVTKLMAGPVVNLSSGSLSFGSQLVNTVSGVESVTLSNVGGAALNIPVNGITASGQFALASTATSCPYTGGAVAAGSSCTIDVTFDPTTAGSQSGSVSITDNAPGSPQSVTLGGTGTAPTVSFTPSSSIGFGNQVINTTSGGQSVTLTNTGTGDLKITSIAISGDFAFAAANTCATGTITATSSCTLAVQFTPTALGLRGGSVTITDNASGSPQSVTLSGSGIDTVPPVVTISANPSTIDQRNGSMVTVTVSGTITDNADGVNASTAAYAVVDEYGLVHPSGKVSLGPGGAYSFNIALQASRNGNDFDGRLYTITVSAKDNAGNLGANSATVVVVHN